MVLAIDRDRWPEPLKRDEVVGVYVGGCVGTGRRFRRKAHAHVKGPLRGVVCYLGASRLDDVRLARHELAHILSGHGHDDKWRAALAELWGGVENIPKAEWKFQKVPRSASQWCKRTFHGMCKGCCCRCHAETK